MTGSAFAVAYRSGVLEAFFHGNTSQVEPYVQTAVGSAENQDYRLTVDSAVCDSQTLYAVITVEGLNNQAVEDLKSNKVIAESHREVWGQEMVDSLMANGSAGPDTFWAAFADSGTHVSGIQYQGLTAPSDTSRSWQVKISSWMPTTRWAPARFFSGWALWAKNTRLRSPRTQPWRPSNCPLTVMYSRNIRVGRRYLSSPWSSPRQSLLCGDLLGCAAGRR